MYKLMIAEDEEIIRRGISKSIPWNELGFEVVFEAGNGQQALSNIDSTKPDVLLTDIRMPVMDGIALAKSVRAKYPNIEIVILSGFSDFEYAREAITQGVFEYLLKPTDKKKFIDCFNRLKEKLDNKLADKNKLFAMGNKLNEGLEKLREDFFLSLIDESEPLNVPEDRMEYLELDFSGSFYAVSVISIENAEEVWKDWTKNLMVYAYKNIINEILVNAGNTFVATRGYQEIIILLCPEDEKDLKLMADKYLTNIVYHIKNILYKQYNVRVYAGVGLAYPKLAQISKSYLQAKKALDRGFFHKDESVCFFKEGYEYDFESRWIKNYPEEAGNIINQMISGNSSQVKALLETMFDTFIQQKLSVGLVKNYCCTLCLLIRSRLGDLVDRVAPRLTGNNTEQQIQSVCSEDVLRKFMQVMLIEITENMVSLEEGEFTYRQRLVTKTKEYIKENYSQNLSINYLCEQVHLSQSYLSNIFKAQTGNTCMEYLKKVRIEKSKELLKETDMRVYEIANTVGYNDYKYFVSQFKKIVGTSPKEYRDSTALTAKS